MAKKSSKKSSTKSALSQKLGSVYAWMKRNKFLALIIILGLMFLIVRQILFFEERYRYNKVESAMDELYAQIVNEVGEPDKTVKDKSCRYASAKFEKGTLSCGVSIAFVFPAENHTEASSIASGALSILDVSSDAKLIDKKAGQMNSFTKLSNNTDQKMVFYYKFKKINKPDCFVSFTYRKIKSNFFIESDKSDQNFAINIHCGSDSKFEQFPVQE